MTMIGLALAAAMTLVLQDAVTGRVGFANGEKSNYQGNTRITVGDSGNDFVVTCTRTGQCTTAWGCRSDRIALSERDATYALAFDIRAEKKDWIQPASTGGMWGNQIRWLDASGALLERRLVNVEFRTGRFERFRFSGEIPSGAAFAEVNFGVDSVPTVLPDERITVRNVTFNAFPKSLRPPPERKADLLPPVVRSVFESPSTDVNLAVKYEITDYTAVDWSAVTVTDTVAKAAVPFARKGNVITLAPDAPWSAGVHRLEVAVRDTLGNAEVSHKVFLIGEAPKAKRVTIRDDGVTLVGGQPFYPIGVYGIKLHEFNDNSFDKAFRDLKAAGLNTGHAYQYRWDAAFLAAAKDNGMKLWTDGKGAFSTDGFFVNTLRDDPATIAWYIGDDTSMNTTPGQLNDRDEACRMLDGTRPTCHADGVRAGAAKSNYEEYVNYADIFLPEIYPVDGTQDERCVAEVCQAMDRCWSDIRAFGDGRRNIAVWAILQCFHGKSWTRYPTHQEMYATSFAAVVHGATGMTWFHYQGDTADPTKRYSGMFRTPEDWACMTNITTRIAALSPVLLERTPEQPPAPEVVSGPSKDAFGSPSVTLLLKRHGGDTYVFAVNATVESVRAKFSLPFSSGEGKVAWEHRAVSVANGVFEDDFEPQGVHVYRFAGK